VWAKCEVSLRSTRWYVQLPLCLSVYNIPGVYFHGELSYRGGIRVNGWNLTRSLMGWTVDRRTDRRLSQLDHVGNERTSLVSDVQLNCVDWGYVECTKQRAGWIPNTDEETDHPDIITLTLPAQGSFLVSNTFHSVYQLKEMIQPVRKCHVSL
jgi:hypothetical protein